MITVLAVLLIVIDDGLTEIRAELAVSDSVTGCVGVEDKAIEYVALEPSAIVKGQPVKVISLSGVGTVNTRINDLVVHVLPDKPRGSAAPSAALAIPNRNNA